MPDDQKPRSGARLHAGPDASGLITWLHEAPSTHADPCPNCGGAGDMREVLALRLPGAAPLTLLRCPHCGCCHFPHRQPPDYAAPARLPGEVVPFYVQQNAGLWPIARVLGRLPHPPGSRYVELGCGFGFGVDYAARARGWQAVGFDPAAMAEAGRGVFGLAIEPRFLAPVEAAGMAADIVMAGEVIEHVAAPPAFLAMLASALRPGGVLVLTTPDAARIAPGTAPGTLADILTDHIVLQSAESLALLLRRAGFAQTRICRDANSLIAYASAAPFDLVEHQTALRQGYLAWLDTLAGRSPGGSDVWLGAVGRRYAEAVIDGDFALADALHPRLVAAVRARYRLDLAAPVLPEGPLHLAEYAAALPFNLAPLLHLRGLHRRGRGEATAALLPQFRAAVAAATLLRQALAEQGWEDGAATDITVNATTEILVALADAGSSELPAALAALPPAFEAAAVARARSRVEAALRHRGHAALLAAVADPAPAPAAPRCYAGAAGLLRLRRDAALLRRSALFDATWYRAQNPDVAAAGMDPARHYLRHGAAEGRDPAPGFVTRDYLACHPDVAAAGVNPLVHYLRAGAREGRALRPAPPPVAPPPVAAPGSAQRPPEPPPIETAPPLRHALELVQERMPRTLPLNIYSVAGAPGTVNVLLEAAGGARMAPETRAAIMLGALLAARRGHRLRIASPGACRAVAEIGALLASLAPAPAGVEFRTDPVAERPLETSPADLFVTLSWQATHAARRSVPPARIIWMLHDDPFLQAGDAEARLRCAALLQDARLHIAIGTAMLAAYLHAQGFAASGHVFEPARDLPDVAPELPPDPPRDMRRLLIHATPAIGPSLFYRAIEAVAEAFDRRVLLPAAWEVVQLGADMPPVAFPGMPRLRRITDPTRDAYAALLRGTDLGLAPWFSPHPGLAALELAEAGAATVTTRFATKTDLTRYAANLICAGPEIGDLVAALGTAAARGRCVPAAPGPGWAAALAATADAIAG